MKKYWFYLFLMSISCKQRDEIHYFNKYGAVDSLIDSHAFTVSINTVNHENRLNFKNIAQTIYFTEMQQQNGIYRRQTDSLLQRTHPFYKLVPSYDYLENNLIEKLPVLNGSVRYQTKKVYKIGPDSFTIISFSESSRVRPIGFWSYYLQDFGFINYYHNESDSYFLCDSIENGTISTQKLHQIEQLLLSDSTFFARHIYNKLNYYRAKGNE